MSALTKLIDFLGLTAQTEELVNAMDDKDASNLQAAKNYADTVAAAAGSSAAASSIPVSQKGTPGGVAELNSQGIVPSHQLPSFVDDVVEGYRLGVHFYSDAAHTTIVTDETGQSADQLSGKIYVDLGDNKTYRWAGSDYAVISESLALGTTEATAGRGDWNYTAYQHALAKGSQFANNLYKITTNAEGHVIAATPVTKQDIVDLGIPGSDTVYEDATTATHGLMSASDKAKLDGIETGAQANPGSATTETPGLMSAADKAKLDGIDTNANNYSLPTMSTSTKGGAKVGHGLSMDGEALNLGPLTDSGSGASVQTDGCGIFGVTGEGWSEQDTTTGKNLFNIAAVTRNDSNGNVSNDSLISNTGIGTLRFSWTGATFSLTESTSVTISADIILPEKTGLTEKHVYFGIANASDSSVYVLGSKIISSFGIKERINVTVTVPSSGSYLLVMQPLGNSGAFTDLGMQCSNVMLEVGSTATSYEPYTGGLPAPSPNYEMPIRVARGRNLMPHASSGTTTKGGCTITERDDGGISFANTSSSYFSYDVYFKGEGVQFVSESGYYTFSASGLKSGMAIEFVYRAYSGDSLHQLWVLSQDGYRTAYLNSEWYTVSIRVVVNASTATNTVIYPQLELGSQATPYVPYGHMGLEVQGKNLIPPRYYRTNNTDFIADESQPHGHRMRTSSFAVSANTVYTVSGMPSGTRLIGARCFNSAQQTLGDASISGLNITTLANAAYMFILFGDDNNTYTVDTKQVFIDSVQLEAGSTATAYEPYHHTTTPIPLPAKGFAGALSDGTADTLAIDSAGRVEWVNVCNEAVFDGGASEAWGTSYDRFYTLSRASTVKRPASNSSTVGALSSHFVEASSNTVASTDLRFGVGTDGAVVFSHRTITTVASWQTWLASNPVTVLYPLATPTTESLGYIALPELPVGATVSIPELEAIGVEWWVEGAEAIVEHTSNWAKRIEALEATAMELEAKFASLGIEETVVGTDGSVTVTYTNGLHVGYNQETFNMYTLPDTPMGVSNEWIYNYDEHVS